MAGTIDIDIDMGDFSYLPHTVMMHVVRTADGDCPAIDVCYWNMGTWKPDNGTKMIQKQSDTDVNPELLPLCTTVCPKGAGICSGNALPAGFKISFPENFCAGNLRWSFLAGNSYFITNDHFYPDKEGEGTCLWECIICEDGTIALIDADVDTELAGRGNLWTLTVGMNPYFDVVTMSTIEVFLNAIVPGAGDFSVVYKAFPGEVADTSSRDPEMNPIFADETEATFFSETVGDPDHYPGCGTSDPVIIEPIV